MIIKKKNGYYVISEKVRKNLGGPYPTRTEAVTRLRQVEFFKHKGKRKIG
jgi:hypothetical protein